MSDDHMRAVRDSIERHEERQREQRQTLRRDFQRQANLLDALATARKVGFVGVLPAAVWIVKAGIAVGGLDAAIAAVIGLICAAVLAWLAPVVGGFSAHFWFRGSHVISSPAVAVAMTLLIDAAFFGWIIVLTT